MQKSSISMIDNLLLSSAVKERHKNLVTIIPEFVETTEFQIFCQKYKVQTHENVGYMFILLDKQWYRPGQIVEGRIFFELFMPSFQTRLMLRLEVKEIFPQRLAQNVFEEFIDKRIGQHITSKMAQQQSSKFLINELPIFQTPENSSQNLDQLERDGYKLDFNSEGLVVQDTIRANAKIKKNLKIETQNYLTPGQNNQHDTSHMEFESVYGAHTHIHQSGQSQSNDKPQVDPHLKKRKAKLDAQLTQKAIKEEDSLDNSQLENSNYSFMNEKNDEEFKKNPMCELYLIKNEKLIFTFDKMVPQGQYEFPFTFRLPNNMPNSCQLKMNNNDEYRICYSFRAYFDSEEPILSAQKNFVVNKINRQRKNNILIQQRYTTTDNLLNKETNFGLESQLGVGILNPKEEIDFEDLKRQDMIGKMIKIRPLPKETKTNVTVHDQFQNTMTNAQLLRKNTQNGDIQIESLKDEDNTCPINFALEFQRDDIPKSPTYKININISSPQKKQASEQDEDKIYKDDELTQSQFAEAQVKCCRCFFSKTKIMDIISIQLLNYVHCLDPSIDTLKFKVHLGLLQKLSKRIDVEIFNQLKLKQISINQDYNGWDTSEIKTNLIYWESFNPKFSVDNHYAIELPNIFNEYVIIDKQMPIKINLNSNYRSSSQSLKHNAKSHKSDRSNHSFLNPFTSNKVVNRQPPFDNVKKILLLSTQGVLISSTFFLKFTITYQDDLKCELKFPIELAVKKSKLTSNTDSQLNAQLKELEKFNFFKPLNMPASHFNGLIR